MKVHQARIALLRRSLTEVKVALDAGDTKGADKAAHDGIDDDDRLRELMADELAAEAKGPAS